MTAHDPGAIARAMADTLGSECPCRSCMGEEYRKRHPVILPMMIVCRTCGNKRCPHAAHHDNACTGSNEPGQPGSDYP